MPYIKAAGELKTKPTQHSVRDLREIGIQPEFLLCRTDHVLGEDIKRKIASFCNVPTQHVIACPDVESVYELPILLHKEGLDDKIAAALNIWSRVPTLERWVEIVRRSKEPAHKATIAIVGKYVGLTDSYKSLNEALRHGGIDNDCQVDLRFVNSEKIETSGAERFLHDVDGILVPGGFGERGTEGKIEAIRFARERAIPFFGICLGLQLAVIELARHVCNIENAASREFDEDARDCVIDLMPDQRNLVDMGATMRLGSYPCALADSTLARRIYGKARIDERHRHRYEVNNDYRAALQEAGLVFSGTSPDQSLVEIVERADHPWVLGCQFHPEFKSGPTHPHPLFSSFISAAMDQRLRTSKNT